MIKFRVLKKNQVLMFVIAFVLVTMGYLTYNPNASTNLVSTTLDNSTYADIGDATLVSSSSIVNKIESSTLSNAIQTSSAVSVENEYFTNSRIERDKMYSQMIESYQKILSNNNISEEQKSIATKELTNINTTKNAIMISENLIKTKGIEDVVIFVNLNSISVIVKADELSKEQIAQIQNIVTRELNVDIDEIHISNK